MSWIICCRIHSSRHHSLWLENAKQTYESRSYGTDGDTKFHWSFCVRYKGKHQRIRKFIDTTLTSKWIPEKRYPRKYDIVGSSHQILHIMVILAGLVHMDGLLRAFRYSHTQGTFCD